MNAALDSDCYPLPIPKGITNLNGNARFAKLELAKVHFRMKVVPESRKLPTIKHYRVIYQFTRLPFGVKTDLAIFHRVMDTMLSGLPAVTAYLDILATGN